MAEVPKDIKNHLASSPSLLDDARALPPAFKHNATRYFLYVKAWELYRIADEKFSSWALEIPIDPRVLRDHGYKLDGSPSIHYVEIENGRAVETTHGSGEEKNKLLQTLIYGTNNKSREEVFMRGWFFDTFLTGLVAKIRLLEVTIGAVEEL